MKQVLLLVAAVALGVVLGVIGLYVFITQGILPALSMPGSRRKTPKSPPRDQP